MKRSIKRIHSPNDLDVPLLVAQIFLAYTLAKEATLFILSKSIDRTIEFVKLQFAKLKLSLTQLFYQVKGVILNVIKTSTFKSVALVSTGFLVALGLFGFKYPEYVIITVPKKITLQSAANGKESRYIKFNEEEKRLLILAHRIGSEYSNYPETIQAIVLQETYAGRYGNRVGDTHQPFGQRSYGVTQCKLSTAKKVLKAYPEVLEEYFDGRPLSKITDEEIIAKLISSDEFAIKIGTLNFVIDLRQYRNWARAVVAYNAGVGNANVMANPELFDYTQKVMRHIKTNVKAFNQQMGLSSI